MYIGIDLGGTNIAAGLVDENGKILHKFQTPTLAERPFEEIVSDMAMAAERVISDLGISRGDIRSIGVGSPGAIDNSSGTILFAGNLGWKNAPLKAELERLTGFETNIENDANAAAYGEYFMHGGGISDFIFITLGTGIGGGIIIDGKIYRGFNGAGAELGHNTLIFGGDMCSCGKRGCWEVYGSVSGLINQTKAAIEKYPDSLMSALKAERGTVDGKTAFDAAKQNDPAAKAVVKQYLEYVADGICSLVNIFEPEVLLIGGGISKEGNFLLDPIKEYCEKNYFCKSIRQTKLGIAKLGNDAGIIGAALSAMRG